MRTQKIYRGIIDLLKAIPNRYFLLFILIYTVIYKIVPGSLTWMYEPSLKWIMAAIIPFLVASWILTTSTTIIHHLFGVKRYLSAIFIMIFTFLAYNLNNLDGYLYNFYEAFFISLLISCIATEISFYTSSQRSSIVIFITTFIFSIFTINGGREYLLYNFTNHTPTEIKVISIMENENNKLSLKIPRAYFENGKFPPDLNTIKLKFIFPNMTPAFQAPNINKSKTLSVGLYLGRGYKAANSLGFYGENRSLKSVKRHGEVSFENQYGLSYYPPPTKSPFTHVDYLYVPMVENPSFIISCYGEKPPSVKSQCIRESLQGKEFPQYIYWFEGGQLPEWQNIEALVARAIQSFSEPTPK
jgi:hypothetical protein